MCSGSIEISAAVPVHTQAEPEREAKPLDEGLAELGYGTATRICSKCLYAACSQQEVTAVRLGLSYAAHLPGRAMSPSQVAGNKPLQFRSNPMTSLK